MLRFFWDTETARICAFWRIFPGRRTGARQGCLPNRIRAALFPRIWSARMAMERSRTFCGGIRTLGGARFCALLRAFAAGLETRAMGGGQNSSAMR